MSKYSMSAGLEAIDALQKLWEASPSFNSPKFTTRFRKVINELDDRRTSLMRLSTSPQIDDQAKKRLISQVEEIQLTFTELNRLAQSVYDQMKEYPGKMPKPIENAGAIFCQCIWGKAKKELFPFIFGFRVGNVFALRYGNVWETQSDKDKAS